MEFSPDPSWFVSILQILAVDLLLGSDNALLVALACRDLPPKLREKAMLLGSIGAFVARVALTFLASLLLGVPYLRLIGGVLLALIALNLAQPQAEHDAKALPNDSTAWSVGLVILTADLVMSLDNVVALAAVARGNFVLLALGLLLSIPALMFGAAILMRLIKRHSWLIQAGAALLGWLGGDLAISDIAIAPWVDVQSPALTLVVPALVALAVLLLPSRIVAGPARAVRKITPKTAITPAPKPTKPTETILDDGENQERYVMIAFLILFLVVGLLLGGVLLFAGGGTV